MEEIIWYIEGICQGYSKDALLPSLSQGSLVKFYSITENVRCSSIGKEFTRLYFKNLLSTLHGQLVLQQLLPSRLKKFRFHPSNLHPHGRCPLYHLQPSRRQRQI